MAHPAYRQDIDGLRAIAVLGVLGFHASKTLFPSGFIGVDIFFVISGYLITHILLRDLAAGKFSLLRFYQRRVRRIFPALLLVLATCFAVGWFVLLPEEFQRLSVHVSSASVFISNIVLWKESGYFDASADSKPLLHLWSLGVEEQFYILWPLLMWAAWRWRHHVLALIFWLFALSLMLSVYYSPTHDAASFYLPHTRFWELMAGGLLAYAERQMLVWPFVATLARRWLSSAGLVLLVAGFALIRQEDAFPGWRAALPVFGATLLIAAGPQGWVNRTLLAWRPLVWIGLISYPLYLWHWPILSFLHITESGQVAGAVTAAAIVLSVLLAWATTVFVERPIRFGRYRESTRCLWVLLAGVVALGVAGVVGDMGKGLAELRGMQNPKFNDLVRLDDFRKTKLTRCEDVFDKLSWCYTSRPGPADFALLGDSHADHLMPGFVAADTKHNWLLIGQSSCPPLKGVRAKEGMRPETCAGLNDLALESLIAQPEIRTVVVAMRGSIYLGQHMVATPDPSAVVTLSRWDDQISSTAEIFEAGLFRTIRMLTEHGKNVVLFLDVPEFDFNPSACIERPVTLFTDASALRCSLPRERSTALHAPMQAIAARMQTQFPKLRVYQSYDALCDEKNCFIGDKEQLFYRDEHHLSIRGSERVAKDFMRWMDGSEAQAPADHP